MLADWDAGASSLPMVVMRGCALLCSAALHTLGVGAAGWATHGLDHDAAPASELRTTRAYALHYLTPTRPKPRPATEPVLRAARMRPPSRLHPPAPSPPPAIAPRARMAGAPRASSLQIRELAPGAIAGVTLTPPEEPVTEPEALPRARGVDRAAALVTPAGSACPELPIPQGRAGREVAVAVAFIVDTSGRVEQSGVRVVESPGRQTSGRGYYPRIYVIGAKAGRNARRVDPAGYDSTVARVVASHVAGLRFQPALVDGRPVRSSVLVACHQEAES